MTNSIKITKYSAIFLAFVLVTGTISALSSQSSFITGIAQAQPYYGMDSYDKPYGKDDRDKSKDNVNLKKVKCNNINVNVNGAELNVTSFPLSGLGADEEDGVDRSIGSYGSYGRDGQSGSDNDFKFVCINNNNNTAVVEVEEPIPPVNQTIDIERCEGCFIAAGVADQQFLVALFAALNGPGIAITLGANVHIANSLFELCFILDTFAFNEARLDSALTQINQQTGNNLNAAEIQTLKQCLAEELGIPI
jgi:hypothetical protein